MNALLVAGSGFLIISLALAWLGVLVLVLRVPALVNVFPAGDYVIKSHIDYLLMALLCYIFHLLTESIPTAVVAAIVVGGTLNPLIFLLMAMRVPDAPPPGKAFSLLAVIGFITTTAGFGGAAILVLL